MVFSSWSDDPSLALAQAVGEAIGAAVGGPLATAVERAQAERDVYLVLDQAEEYFLYHAGDRRAFAERCPLSLHAPLRVNVLSRCARTRSPSSIGSGPDPRPLREHAAARPPRPQAGRAAILGPVERYNELAGDPVEIEPGLVEAVLDQVRRTDRCRLGGVGAARRADRPGRGSRRRTSNSCCSGSGRGAGRGSACCASRRSRARRSPARSSRSISSARMAALSAESRDVAARIFDHLVTPRARRSRTGARPRRVRQVDATELRPVLDVLVRERILRSDEDGARVRYEIFHDVLAQPMLAWRARHLTQREIEQHVEERARRKSRMQRLLALAVGLGAVLVGAILFAVLQQRNADEKARDAHARTLDASAIALTHRGSRAQPCCT